MTEGGFWSCSSLGDKSRGGKLCSLATTCLQTPLHLDRTLLPSKFNTICTILHFSQAWYRALLHWSTVELSSPSWSYIGHYCSPPRVRRQFSRRRPRSQKVDAAANWKMLITVGTQRKLSGTVRRLRHFSGICATQSRRCRAKDCG